jgi:hypothetical protein
MKKHLYASHCSGSTASEGSSKAVIGIANYFAHKQGKSDSVGHTAKGTRDAIKQKCRVKRTFH